MTQVDVLTSYYISLLKTKSASIVLLRKNWNGWEIKKVVSQQNAVNTSGGKPVQRPMKKLKSGSNQEKLIINFVPRSPVDEAEGEIWQSKKICFSWLAAPFDSCPIPSLTQFSAENFLQTQVLDWKFPRTREERFGSNLPLGIEQLLQHDRTVT